MTAIPLLSVVIPSYNYARYLGDCLTSIFSQQDPPPFEVLVNPALQLEAWAWAVRAQFEGLPGLTKTENAAVEQFVELQVIAAQPAVIT